MFRPPDHNHILSMRLSEVFHDMGVTENMVKKTRRSWMINEAIANTGSLSWDNKITTHFFGSKSESSTTKGMDSDVDYLMYLNNVHVIQDWFQWQPDRKLQYLMIQDETTSPGYCLLQLLETDAPLPAENIQDEYHSTDNMGRVLLRHTSVGGTFRFMAGFSQHGPARTDSGPYRGDTDFVMTLHCPFWPREAELWLHQQNVSGWPTEDMKRYSAQQGCFVVPVGSRTGIYQDLEWRISTSLAERCLMYNINMTQIRCYILMKMIIKTFLKPKCGDVVSSFMCKNILFYCIAGAAASSTWNEGSLLTWLNQCLQTLFHCILTGNCPHFVIPRNNLLADKLSAEIKLQLADVMCILTANIEQSLLGIQIDDLGNRLHVKSGSTCILSGVDLADDTAILVATDIIIHTTKVLYTKNLFQDVAARDQNPVNILSKLCQLYWVASRFEKVAINLLAPLLCTSIGSMTASVDIHHSRTISPEAFRWLSMGLNSDVSSSRLKLASALYCAGDLERCEVILTAVRAHLSQTTVQTICHCYPHAFGVSTDFAKLCNENNEDVIKHNIPLCVQYLPCEVNCIPVELRYEMFRSTEEDRPYRERWDIWMDWAVVDSLSYLFFLQYKVYSQLKRPAEQNRALYNLATIIHTDENLFHRETALNLLGQCMEQQGRHQDALYCYIISLEIRGRNNAAKWHVCRLLARLFHR